MQSAPAQEKLLSVPFPRLSPLAAAAAALLLVPGCTLPKDHKGYVGDSMLTGMIAPGVDNRDSVQATLGRPSFVSQFDPNIWYYISRDTSAPMFQMPKPTAQTVIEVRFDKAGNVTAVNKSGLDKVASIHPEGDKTPTLGRNRGFFTELFGNIGRAGGSQGAGKTADNPEGD